jgi:hypothetical protein
MSRNGPRQGAPFSTDRTEAAMHKLLLILSGFLPCAAMRAPLRTALS